MDDISTLRVDFCSLFCKVANYTVVLRVGAISTLGIFLPPLYEAYYYSAVCSACHTTRVVFHAGLCSSMLHCVIKGFGLLETLVLPLRNLDFTVYGVSGHTAVLGDCGGLSMTLNGDVVCNA